MRSGYRARRFLRLFNQDGEGAVHNHMTPQTPHDDTPFARRMACDLGKATQELKTKVDEQTEYQWLRLCAQKNTTTAVLLRDFIFLAVHGKTHSVMVAEQRLHDVESNDVLALAKGLFEAPESVTESQHE